MLLSIIIFYLIEKIHFLHVGRAFKLLAIITMYPCHTCADYLLDHVNYFSFNNGSY